MGERIDHFAGMRTEPEPQVRPDLDAPTFTQAHVDYLRRQFPEVPAAVGTTMDGLVDAVVQNSHQRGVNAVLAFMQSLARG